MQRGPLKQVTGIHCFFFFGKQCEDTGTRVWVRGVHWSESRTSTLPLFFVCSVRTRMWQYEDTCEAVYIYIYNVYIYICTNIYEYIHHLSIYLLYGRYEVYILVHTYVCMYACIYVYIYIYIYNVCMYMYICMYVCMYIHIFMYIYIMYINISGWR
jgi:nuclear pore complex protein Nup62